MEDRRKRVEEELIEALGSEGKIRILRMLAEKPNSLFTAYSIVKATGLRRQDTNKHLRKLCEIGWLKQHRYGVTKYQINVEKDAVGRLMEFLKAIEAI